MSLKHFLFGVIGLSLGMRANAQLQWEEPVQELHPSFTDKAAVAHFKYENTGSKPVHIHSVRTSCGCTVATLKSNDVAPGEKGEITASLNIGNRTGTQNKIVTVNTDDPENPRVTLTLRAVIPSLLEVQPTFVFWSESEPPKPKIISVKAPKDSPVTKVNVSSSNPQITTKLDADGPKQWKISVLPKDTKSEQASILTIAPDYPPDSPKRYFANVRVSKSAQE